ncbi:cap-specific mRNA (nucleoside-2'-O-)-methyltransferase 1 [Halyomorpha halys]|uniref:cap-specific mRNA (nucleoside-2'-O-)-methyltransferase 1 n=1 Tax=Halyomorpha halys TaxID=286706 RepID=UPI0006D4D9AB|nr:cap-specific mRNA (nucleoside-2'-O-)-methyltransferase 1 [Halyomorpha halys]
MSNLSGTSGSSDEGSNSHSKASYGDPRSHQSSDDYLEVVDNENVSISYKDDLEKYPEYSIPNSDFDSASHFYKSVESEKNNDSTYSLDNSSKDSSPSYLNNSESEQSFVSVKAKSKKKKGKSSRSKDFDNYSKNKDEQPDFGSSKKRSSNPIFITKSEQLAPLKVRISTTLSDSSDNSDNSQNNYSKKESKSSKRKRQSNVESTGLKKRLESNNKGNLLMKKMGYREGEGLGKHAQGRIDPVEMSNQKGRRGLGLTVPRLDGQTIEWDPTLEEINEIEPIDWLENFDTHTLNFQIMMDNWINEGPQNFNIESMTEFIDEDLLSNILQKKSIFDNLSEDELRRAVTRSNPFETIRKGIFLNRAAVKMANIDFAFDHMFTNPRYRDNSPMVRENELLMFADVCAGPGGFSEYILHRKNWYAKGIGFTLKGDNDFKLQDFLAGPSETFEPYYGEKGDGNIFDPSNISSLTNFVMKVTEGKGVHFMMADGGFSVKGQENIQELLSKQLYLCQFLVALSIVREEGHFVCKLFDVVSEFSAGLIYLMHKAFHKISIFKPNTSRPANSERYIICKHKMMGTDSIRDFLFEINSRLWNLGKNSKIDINGIVPLEIMKDNVEFFNYLRDSNNRLGNRQIVNLDKIAAYYQDSNLHEKMQSKLRNRCMELWQVPAGPRKADQRSDMELTKAIMQSILKDKFRPELVTGILNHKGENLVPENMVKIFQYSILDWNCIPLGSDKISFLLGMGKNKVYRWATTKWEYEPNLELTPGTLIYGEFMPEYRGNGMKQTKINAFHIIDGISLGYQPISHYQYNERLDKLNLYVKALKKWNCNNLCPIRVKIPTPLKDIYSLFERVEQHLLKSSNYQTCLFDHDYHHFMQLKGMVFIRTTREPWRRHLSKKYNCHYYYNSADGKSLFERDRPIEADASALDSLKYQILWMFQVGVGFKGEPRQDHVLHKDDLVRFIQKRIV